MSKSAEKFQMWNFANIVLKILEDFHNSNNNFLQFINKNIYHFFTYIFQ